MTTLDPSTRGRRNRANGALWERDLARWLRTAGFLHAERAVRTGYRTAERVSADHGDITGTPGLVWQVTGRADLDQDAVLTRRLAETEAQRVAAGAGLGLLVQKRPRCADVGRWWVWLHADRLADLGYCATACGAVEDWHFPTRTELRYVVPLLVRAGYAKGGTT